MYVTHYRTKTGPDGCRDTSWSSRILVPPCPWWRLHHHNKEHTCHLCICREPDWSSTPPPAMASEPTAPTVSRHWHFSMTLSIVKWLASYFFLDGVMASVYGCTSGGHVFKYRVGTNFSYVLSLSVKKISVYHPRALESTYTRRFHRSCQNIVIFCHRIEYSISWWYEFKYSSCLGY